MEDGRDILVLFDVDGTLTPSRQVIEPEMVEMLQRLKEKVVIGFVGGSNLEKQIEQLGSLDYSFFDFSFPENGIAAYKGKTLLQHDSFLSYIGEPRYQELINFTLRYLSELTLPFKRGTFVEYRTGMLNVCPVGRDCSYEERLSFYEFDCKEKIRERMVEAYQKRFLGYGLKFSIGGQISIDIFPEGWDKTYCLRHLEKFQFKEIHFFGDKTMPGGNDYEIFNHPAILGYSVTNPADTLKKIKELFNV